MNAGRNVIFAGGPESGKSNYLFRSWIAIERETGRLIKDGLPFELGYLHDGASTLLDGSFAPHTSRDTRQICEIPVADRRRLDRRGQLVIPDASGELWLDLFEKREWPLAWDSLVTLNSGFLLFVRAASPHNVPALDWVTCERLYNGALQPHPTGTPTQVLLVDWLQILRSIVDQRVHKSFAPRLSVVVSAWDRVTPDQQYSPPRSYLEREFPLFSQFLQSGAHGFEARVFGVSIVGGDLDVDDEFRNEYRSGAPGSFGYMTIEGSLGQSQRDPDILGPIYWAMGLDT